MCQLDVWSLSGQAPIFGSIGAGGSSSKKNHVPQQVQAATREKQARICPVHLQQMFWINLSSFSKSIPGQEWDPILPLFPLLLLLSLFLFHNIHLSGIPSLELPN